MVGVVVDLVVDVLAPWLPLLLHPAVRMQMLATASAAVSWRTSSPPFRRCHHQPISTALLPLQRCRLKLGVMSVSSPEVGRTRVGLPDSRQPRLR